MTATDTRPLVIFDFDGVIVDTFELTHGLTRKLEIDITSTEYRNRYEGNIFTTHVEHVEETKPGIDLTFRDHYAPGVYQLPPEPGMADAITHLATNYELTIVTSCWEEVVLRYLSLYGMEQRFSSILGCMVERSKVKKFHMLAHEHRPKVFITDTLGDILEATEVGIPSIAVSWGYHEPWRLEKGRPVSIIDSPWQLVETVHRVLKTVDVTAPGA